MVAFSSGLEQSLHRALAIAKERRHERAMLDHLLLALTDDQDAAAVMRGCNVDVEKLRRALDLSLAGLKEESTADGDAEPRAAGEVQAVIQQAVIHIESIGHEVVTGAHVLVEILDHWPASFLQEQGLTRYDAVTFLTHGAAEHAVAPAPREGEGVALLFKVLMLNDDYTPMEFVVHVLERFFDQDRERAAKIMLHVHNHGSAECGAYLHAVASTKVRDVTDFAREHQHPLRCVLLAG
jgi:ATP-dependent Clp protease adapter protein ClpS